MATNARRSGRQCLTVRSRAGLQLAMKSQDSQDSGLREYIGLSSSREPRAESWSREQGKGLENRQVLNLGMVLTQAMNFWHIKY